MALRTAGDNIAVYQCSIKGYQDTLPSAYGQQFFRESEIYGTVDFIFGDANVVFQNCMIYVRKPTHGQVNVITAQGRGEPKKTGTVLHNCSIIVDKEFEPYTMEVKTFLGRPWLDYSQTIVMECFLGEIIDPEGWLKFNGDVALSPLHYVEYGNRGARADTKGRITWPGYNIANNSNDVQEYTVNWFINGTNWLPRMGVPFMPRFIN
ncbi:pectinesterase 2-like [Quercus suber]